MILNGLGFSNRRLYLVSQFFATKPVEHLLESGIKAEQLHDDCLGRTVDWLYDHDPTALFAGMARQARQRFGIAGRQVHVDTTSFAVTGEYAEDLDAHTLAVSLVMVLCLLVYRLAEHRLREQLAATDQTVPNQLKQPTDRPTMRWIFQCFEGVSLVAFQPPQAPPHLELAGPEPLHKQAAVLLGPDCEKLYKVDG
jgi:transposase